VLFPGIDFYSKAKDGIAVCEDKNNMANFRLRAKSTLPNIPTQKKSSISDN
jgi:hypothetical protein